MFHLIGESDHNVPGKRQILPDSIYIFVLYDQEIMIKTKPIDAVGLLPKTDGLLIELLEGLSATDWDKQTITPQWKVRDTTVYLLGGNLRTLSMLE